MSYIDKNLLTDEKIIFRTKKHLIIFFIPMLWTAATLFCYFNENPYLVKASILPAIAGFGAWLNSLLIYVTSEFAVTNKRIMMKEGFFFRHSNEIRLATVAKVSVNQSLLAQLLNYGTVNLDPFGGKTDSFSEIASPFVFQKEVQEQLDKNIKS
jgi:uncharacterized membrane protein YdbT with pleckstrin-like domain